MELIIHGFSVVIDDEDKNAISNYNWQVNDYSSERIYFYVYKRENQNKRKKIYLHRFIMKAVGGNIVDHINGNTLDCRKINMRITDRTGNARNSRIGKNNISGYKGVSWAKNARKWRVRIMFENKYKHIGYFETKEEAYSSYCESSKKYHGEFGRVE